MAKEISTECPKCGKKGFRPVNVPYGAIKCKYCYYIAKAKLTKDGYYTFDSQGRYAVLSW